MYRGEDTPKCYGYKQARGRKFTMSKGEGYVEVSGGIERQKDFT